jgi:hypothetical protein
MRLSNLPDGEFVSIFVKQNEGVGRKANESHQVLLAFLPRGKANRSLALIMGEMIPKVMATENFPWPVRYICTQVT